MKLQHKILLILSLVFLVTFSVVEYLHFQSEKNDILESVRQEARNVQGILLSIRRVYHQQFLESGIPLNEKTIGFLPPYALSRISEDFNKWTDYPLTFNNVSDRPRNPENMADPLEMEAIKFYRQNPDASERFVPYESPEGEDYYHFSAPIRVEKYCLKCHGRRVDAPPMIRDTYTTAFDYKVGDLRGIMSIKLPTAKVNAMAWEQFKVSVLIRFTSFFILFVVLTWLIFRYVTIPLARLDKGLRRISSGSYDYSIVGLTGEMNAIAESYDHMASELDKRENELTTQSLRRETLNIILRILQQDIPIEEQFNNILKALFFNTWFHIIKNGSIFLVDKESGELMLIVHQGVSAEIQASCDRVPIGKCLCGHAVETGEVIFSDSLDKRHEITYDGIEPHGHYCIPIKSGSETLGVIELYVSADHRRDRIEEEFLIAVANAMAARLERKYAEEQLKSSLKEKKILLAEIHHRVKNNLQVINGFLQIQSDALSESSGISIEDVLQDSQNRIKSMAVIHDIINRSDDIGFADINESINIVCRDLIDTYHMEGRVKSSVSGIQIFLNIDQAMPCSLIINELIMNSLKHAFPGGKKGKIEVFFTEDESKMVEIVVSDDGVGIGNEVNWEAPASVGLDLVKGLVGQIDGTIELDRSNGTRYNITFRRL